MNPITCRWTRRIAGWITALVLGIWIVLAIIVSSSLGFRSWAFLVGLKSAPLITIELLTPNGNSLRALPDTPATALLGRNFGDGVNAADGRKLYDLVVSRGYRRALDVGTGRGYAAMWLGMAMRRTGGKVITIEIDPAKARQARENFRHARLDDLIESRINDARREITAAAGSFDLIFLDLGGAHHEQLFALLHPRLAPGGAIVSHNAFALPFADAGYLPTVYRAADLKTSIVPTLSGGLAMSVKAR